MEIVKNPGKSQVINVSNEIKDLVLRKRNFKCINYEGISNTGTSSDDDLCFGDQEVKSTKRKSFQSQKLSKTF